jgi:hypothetical protein
MKMRRLTAYVAVCAFQARLIRCMFELLILTLFAGLGDASYSRGDLGGYRAT